jgi:hypothetical protein
MCLHFAKFVGNLIGPLLVHQKALKALFSSLKR